MYGSINNYTAKIKTFPVTYFADRELFCQHPDLFIRELPGLIADSVIGLKDNSRHIRMIENRLQLDFNSLLIETPDIVGKGIDLADLKLIKIRIYLRYLIGIEKPELQNRKQYHQQQKKAGDITDDFGQQRIFYDTLAFHHLFSVSYPSTKIIAAAVKSLQN